MQAPLVIAHRGASGYRPEHSEDAYRLAAQLGADAIEPDLVATKDGVLVLRHENEISGTTDVASRPEFARRRTTKTVDGVQLTGWFTEDFTWKELRTLAVTERIAAIRPHNASFNGKGRIQRFDELLDILDETGLALVAEIKHASYFAGIGLPLDELFSQIVSDRGWSGNGRLTIESFEEEVLHKIRARGVDGDLVYLMEHEGAAPDLLARLGAKAPTYSEQLADLDALAARVDGISVQKKMLFEPGSKRARTNDLVDRAHDAGLRIFTWTLRPENAFLDKRFRSSDGKAAWGGWMREWDLIVGSGVDAVFADHPDLARYVVRRAAGVGE